MKVLIQFNDKNKNLARAIGLGLQYYGESLAVESPLEDAIVADPADKLRPAEPTTTENIEKDWSKVADKDIPTKQVITKAAEASQTEPTETITPDNKGPELIPPGPVETDEHGVPFDAAFCGVSKDKPFYVAGRKTGQWKKKRGVDVDEYDLWYDENRPAAAEPEPGKVDTAAAFAAPGTGADPEPATTDLPTLPGDLMKWCAEQTAAGAMTTAEVTAAYTACGITVADMFGPEGEAHVQAILAVLVK
jgi:hypothetical protein